MGARRAGGRARAESVRWPRLPHARLWCAEAAAVLPDPQRSKHRVSGRRERECFPPSAGGGLGPPEARAPAERQSKSALIQRRARGAPDVLRLGEEELLSSQVIRRGLVRADPEVLPARAGMAIRSRPLPRQGPAALGRPGGGRRRNAPEALNRGVALVVARARGGGGAEHRREGDGRDGEAAHVALLGGGVAGGL